MTNLTNPRYRSYGIPFVRKDTRTEDVIYLGAYSRQEAEHWLLDRKDYCERILPANRVASILRRLEGDKTKLQQKALDAVSGTDRLHPESMSTLRQLVKLHGAERVIEAVREIEHD